MDTKLTASQNQPIQVMLKTSSEHKTPAAINTLHKNWFGAPVSEPIQFTIELEPESLCVTVATSKLPTTHPLDGKQPFVEGLWEFDVFELFIRSKGSSSYTEINLAPSGSWWACQFTEYRKRAEIQLIVQSKIGFESKLEKGWHATYRIPYQAISLPPAANWLEMQVQATAIQHYGQSQQFLAWNVPLDREPDFHFLDHLENSIRLIPA
jgi:hypothetical protein